MKYDYMPGAIISRTMVHFRNDVVPGQQWRHGMMLNNDDLQCQAKIKSNEEEKTIAITVQGKFSNKRDYFAVIRHAILNINKDFQNMKVEEFVPLPGYPDCSVKYQELLGHETAGKTEYFSGELGKTFSVPEMLDRIVSKEERKNEGITGENKGIIFNPKIDIDLSNIGNPIVSQSQTVTVEIKQDTVDAHSLFKKLKDDILKEVDIEIDDEKEKKRIVNDLQNAEEAFAEVEKTAAEGKKAYAGTKDRFKDFIAEVDDGNSRINRTLRLVKKGSGKGEGNCAFVQ